MIDYSRYYRAYAEMKETLDGDYAKMYLTSALADADDSNDSLTGSMSNRVIDMDWVLKFEDCVPYIEKAIDEQRKFIEEYKQVDRIDKIKQVRRDAITHLTQHTNLIQSVEPDGSVVPGQLLNTLREDSFATYENRFLYTLLFKTISFIEARFRALQNAPNDSLADVTINRDVQLNKQSLSLSLSYNFESHERDKINKEEDLESLTDYERILRLRMKLDDLVGTNLIQTLKGCIQVKSPINKTNCIKQDPAFKKCYELWSFIESYLKPGYILEVDEFDGTVPESMKNEMYDLMAYEHFVMLMNTNPALRQKLDEEYLAEKKRREEEANKPEEEIQRYIEDKIYEARREEMALRLAEVRDRESQIMKLTSELELERERVKELEKRVEELQALVEQREKELEETRNQLRLAQIHITKLEAVIISLKTEIEELENHIKYLEEEYEIQAILVNKLNNTIDDKNLTIKELEEANSGLKDTVKCHEKTIACHEQTIANYEKTISEKELTIASNISIIDEMNNKHNDLLLSHNELQKQLDVVEENYHKYEDTISNIKSENEEMSHTIRVHENMLSAKDAIINTAHSERDALQQRVNAFDEYHDRLKKESDSIKDKYEARESELVGLSNTISSQSNAMAKHQEEMKVMRDLVDQTTREKDSAIEELKNIQIQEINKLKSDYENRISLLEKQVVEACTFNDEEKYGIRLENEKKLIQSDYDNKLAIATKKARKFVKKARVLVDDYPDKLLNMDGVEDYK